MLREISKYCGVFIVSSLQIPECVEIGYATADLGSPELTIGFKIKRQDFSCLFFLGTEWIRLLGCDLPSTLRLDEHER
jgi:hypothetical protein